ncbi:MAG: hypothetical protein JW814_05845 [Candidatus Krumholzibacteriota bacterium]|nr:hypothetical protein [Candidatus Krumholzibacteriota bacterium]
MRKILLFAVSAAISLSVVLINGCSDGVFTGSQRTNEKPEIWLSSGPVEGDTTGYQVHFYWSGWDPDGEVSHFEICIVDGGLDGIGFNEADTAGADKWIESTAHDSIFRVLANENPRPYDEDDPTSVYTRFDLTHTLFIRAIDEEGLGSDVVFRSFTAWTIAPIAIFSHPPAGTLSYSTVITFRWDARDPIDSPSNSQDPDSIRYMVSLVLDKDGIYNKDFPIIQDLNENPGDYEDLWSRWIYYRAPGDSGRTTKIGDDEVLELNKQHIFAVQAKDEAGAVSAIFKKDLNIKQFTVSWKQGPLLKITEPFLGGAKFLGTLMNPIQHKIPPGIPLNFCWEADAFSYGGEIVGYRYGWDIQDLGDPNQWEGGGAFSPYTTCAKEKKLYSGVHTLFIEVKDDGGRITRGKIEIEVIQFTMERTLLWVDDLASTETPNPLRTMPLESEHDAFWIDICSRADGFEPDRDVYDARSYNLDPPKIETIGKYANIIWTFNSATVTAWKDIVHFIPESMVGQAAQVSINYIALFMAKGGHMLTCGRNDRSGGGFYDVFYAPPQMPAVFKNDMLPDSDDTSGVNSMPYKDYCASVLDKVDAIWHTGDDMAPGVTRRVDRDAMKWALKNTLDPIVNEHLAGFPDSLRLWDEITCPTCFFNPQLRGFTYVEIFDPQYWLDFKQINVSQGCFHPTYRMVARNVISPINNQPMAMVVTKYKDRYVGQPDLNFIPAYSFHFGVPLWFFNRHDVDRVIDVIFTEWQILSSE